MTSKLSPRELSELRAAIAQSIARMDELRERMRRDSAEIEESRQATHALLADIAEVLADLKAA